MVHGWMPFASWNRGSAPECGVSNPWNRLHQDLPITARYAVSGFRLSMTQDRRKTRRPPPPRRPHPSGRSARPLPPPPPPLPRSPLPPVAPPVVPPVAPPSTPLHDLQQQLRQPVRRRWRWVRNWQVWGTVAVLMTTGTGLLAAALLFKIPALPNCPEIFWPTASASLRMYCAEIAANKRTVDDLLEAIRLVESLPDDHPLRREIDEAIAKWSMQILDLGDETFQRGNLEQAIAIAERIPNHLAAAELVEDRIEGWQLIWAEGEAIYREVEAALREQRYPEAFRIANQLLYVDNAYWQTTKHEELNALITTTRKEGETLLQAQQLADRGGTENLIEAIRLVQTISPNSYAYTGAQRLLTELGEDFLDLAQRALDREDYDGAIAIVRSIPADLDLGDEAQDFLIIAEAQSRAWRGTALDLEEAILQAQRLRRDRPLYGRAQDLIRRWRLEIQDVARLDTARQLAQTGRASDLRAAIAESRQIPDGNPRAGEAQRLESEWLTQIQRMEDQPILAQAEQQAQPGTAAALRQAIATAEQISSNRALSGQARERIDTWTAQLQRMEDQPILDRARQLANAGDWQGAIATAQQISSGRALYRDAQNEVTAWQNRVEGQLPLQDAYAIASSGSVSGLVAAIDLANQVPGNNSSRSEADRMINTWSYQLLDAADQQAAFSLDDAIAIAQRIPPRTEAYAAAQLRIQRWQQQINAVPLPPDPPTLPPN
jgi:soluble cytochrome b562